MANATSKIDLTIPLATFLAQVEGDGTIADVIDDLKVDRTGYEVNASGISVAGGQRWANLVDDFIQKVYALNPGREDYALQTVGAVSTTQTIATLAVDGDLWRIGGIVTGRTSTAAEVVSARIDGHFYRSGGTVLPLDPTHAIVQLGLAGVDAALVIATNDVQVQVTGIGGKTIDWSVRINYAEKIS